ncbi:hypothetical protein GQ464_009895 [Rhodocaloribacter litoris]|uniref:hypothetical protein n=1 Tax=Rhodocaloribacter litoris TaxID=2558931 RepID=UPI00141EF230|nr:hypothetical protein [Rhodocaloribacter litoris]QXD13784.1 hypothetical protein GQ464_009895 [Rhodocaloribacter litoris]
MRSLTGKVLLLGLLLGPVPLVGSAQTPDAGGSLDPWQASGYVKILQSAIFLEPVSPRLPFETQLYDNLLHQRLNLDWYASEHLSLQLGWRNRLFWGDQVRLFGASFIELQEEGDELLDLSWGHASPSGVAVHSAIDRLYATWTRGLWEVRLGRQRINWGISTIWNPNDLFNTFSFVDFDYEERPGSDALRIQRYLGFAARLELAVRPAGRLDEAVIAGLYAFNRAEYDVQILAGRMRTDWVLGAGWAGALGEAGFKGEWTAFYDPEADRIDLAATVALDYMWPGAFYLNAGFLYTSTGTTDGALDLFGYRPSAKTLYPFTYSLLLTSSYAFTPLLNGSLTLIYSPGPSHTTFLNPTLTLSIADNWDLALVGQLEALRRDGTGTLPVKAAFLRLKFSY